MNRVVGLTLLAVCALAACTEPSTAPFASKHTLSPSFSLVSGGTAIATGRHIVSFTSTSPAGFQSRAGPE
jgi:hypothetical protein